MSTSRDILFSLFGVFLSTVVPKHEHSLKQITALPNKHPACHGHKNLIVDFNSSAARSHDELFHLDNKSFRTPLFAEGYGDFYVIVYSGPKETNRNFFRHSVVHSTKRHSPTPTHIDSSIRSNQSWIKQK